MKSDNLQGHQISGNGEDTTVYTLCRQNCLLHNIRRNMVYAITHRLNFKTKLNHFN
jgi:hypothetical protein